MLSQRAIISWWNSCALPQFLQTKFCFAERATYEDPVSYLCSRTLERPASKHLAYDGDINQNLAPLRSVSAGQQAPEPPRGAAQTTQKLIQPTGSPAFLFQGELARKRKTQQKTPWLATHGRDITERAGQTFPPDGVRWVLSWQEVTALQEPVAGQNGVVARSGRQQCSIVAGAQGQPRAAFGRQSCFHDPSDELVFSDFHL